MSSSLQDLRFAARQLRRQPGYTLIVILTLALGVGTTTTAFSLLNAVALRPIPFSDPDRLVAVHVVDRRASARFGLSLDTFAALQQTRGAFSGSIAYVTDVVTAKAEGLVERVPAAEVSGDLFSLLGLPVQIGRGLAVTDAGARVAVIADDLWVRGFGSNPGVVGMTISVDGDSYVVVGVARRRFSFPQDSRVWVPLGADATRKPVEVVARLDAGVSPAQADVAVRAATAATLSAPASEYRTVITTPLRQVMIGTKQRDMSLFVLTAAGLVLLVACANLAGLLMAYVGGRKHEFALRAALGAARARLVRQLMTESLGLALVAGAIGLLLAQWGVAVFAALLGKPRGAEWIEMTVDGRVLMFALAASMFTAVLFGLAPALGASRVDLRGSLQEDGRTGGSGLRRRRLRGLLVAGQVALSIGLLCGAAAVVASSLRLDDVEPGFTRDRLLAVRVALVGRAYDHPEQRLAFVDAAADRLRALPGVASVTATSHLPLVDRDVPYSAFAIEGIRETERPPFASLRFVDSDYLALMGIPIRRGRAFTRGEARHLQGDTVVINDTMARRYWPERDPIGSRLRLTGATNAVDGWYTVIGVVGDVAQRQLPAAPENQLYLPLAAAREVTFVVRAISDPAALSADARDAARSVDSALAISTTTMQAAYEWYVYDRGLQGIVLGTLGIVAMLIAALGVYGVMSLMVAERSREIAIRMALGSTTAAIRRLMLGRGLRLVSFGVGTGLLLASALTAFLSSIFLGVRAFDAPILAAAAALLGAVSLMASWWPARRAMRLDPMITLKQ